MRQITGAPPGRRYTPAATTTSPTPNGPAPEDEAPADTGGELPWRSGGVRRGPALVVVAIVLVVSLGGFLLAALGGHSPTVSGPGKSVVAGTGLTPAAAAALFAPVSTGGDPPHDVLAALTVPAGSTVVSHERGDGLDLYSGSVSLTVPAEQAQVEAFYKKQLKSAGWSLAGPDATADGQGVELFGTRASDDGYYWELVATIRRANPSLTPALNGDTPSGATSLELTLFERDDAD